MQSLISTVLPGAALLLLTPVSVAQPSEGHTLSTQYASIEIVQVAREVTFGMEVTSMEIEVDGEPQESMGRMGGGNTTHVRRVYKDDIKKVGADNVPTHIVRTFGDITGKRITDEGEQEIEASPMQPASGLVLDIEVNAEGEQKIKVVEGEAPENDAFLAAQPMVFAVDGLLPSEAVEVDGTWDLDSDAIRQALGDLVPARAPRGERPNRRERDDRSVTQDGRRRGQGMRRMGGDIGGFLKTAEWTGEGTLVSLKKEYEGAQYAFLEFTMECEGDLPEPEQRAGRRGRGGDDQVALPTTRAQAVEGEATLAIKGKMYFDMEAGRPVAVMLEGKIEASNSRTMNRGDREISMYSEQEGEVKVNYTFQYEKR